MMNLPQFSGARQAKPIEQLTMDGELIKEWSSGSEAHRVLRINQNSIIAVMKGKREEAGGYKWRYK